MVKKDKKYHKLHLEQSRLKSTLHENIRQFLKYKQTNPKGSKTKASVTMSELENQQNQINQIRKQIGKIPIRLIENLKDTLVRL